MITDLHRHDIPGVATFDEGPGGLPVLIILAPTAEARIFVHGAQLTHWRPVGAEPVIFLSEQSAFGLGKAIRGGVPVCFPWFGPRAGQGAHGFARNRNWIVDEVTQLPEGSVRAVFSLESSAETRVLWPHDFRARLIYTIGSTLAMELEVENISAEHFTISEALHTYLLVGDARQIVITGLEDTEYRDFPDRTQLTRQAGPIQFTEETDRVYVNTQATCILDDPLLARRILVSKLGSDTTTIWNPWIAKSESLTDFGDDEWLRMACIETVNAFENSVTIAPGEKHTMGAYVAVESRSAGEEIAAPLE
jgi:glucose-6-phosphate 1-epimerase